MAFDPVTQQMVLYGGALTQYACVPPSDTWLWNGTSWSVKTLHSSPPQAEALGIFMATDFAGRRVILMDPTDISTWSWNGSEWRRLGPAPAIGPVTFDPSSGHVLMLSEDGTTWILIGDAWTQLHPTHSPVLRFGEGLTTAGPSVLLFGGFASGSTPLDDTWTWDGRDWRRMHPSASPPATGFETLLGFSQGAFLYSPARSYTAPAGTWGWNGVNWSLLNAISPPTRVMPTGAFDSANSVDALFGGDRGGAYGGMVSETWIFDGHTWRRAA